MSNVSAGDEVRVQDVTDEEKSGSAGVPAPLVVESHNLNYDSEVDRATIT